MGRVEGEVSRSQSPPLAAEPLVGCVILNSNRRDDTLECLRSLAAGVYRNYFAIVLDCMSSDNSVTSIRSEFRDVEVCELRENRGYTGNNNIGIRAALARGADWVFVLNEDTVLDSDCIKQLINAADGDRRVGIAGPMVYHHDEENVIQSAGGGMTPDWRAFHFGQNEQDRGQFPKPRPVRWISGCAILVRNSVIEDVGLLDERFFIYWEETEWCLRAGHAGWEILHVPTARVWHKGVQRHYQPKPHVTYYSTRNHLLALHTHAAPRFAQLIAWWKIVRTLANWTLRPKWRDKRAHRDAMWRAVVDYLQGHSGPMRQ